MTYSYLKKIVQNSEDFIYSMKARNADFNYNEIEKLFELHKLYIQQKEQYEFQLNSITNEIQKNIANKTLVEDLKQQIKDIKTKKDALVKPDIEIVNYIPNLLQKSVPVGPSSDFNKVIKEHLPKPTFSNVIPHYQFKEIQISTACNMSGSRFVIFSGKMAQLFRALAAFFLSELKTHGFEEIILPYLVLDKTMYNTGNLPKFEEDSFKTDKYRLIPTAEVPLVNIYQDQTLENLDTIRVCAFTPCFRSEVGSAGLDTQGIKRLHQFHKVEMVSITRDDNSFDEHEKLLAIEESILQKLNIHYRILCLASGDTGFGSSKTYDIEVFMPSTNQYMEISSCSNCLDFQSIRSNIKFKNLNGEKLFAHTLNGSAFPLERLIAAIVENFQVNGEVVIPNVLLPFLK